MGAYMYPIRIKKEPQMIRYYREVALESEMLTLVLLRKLVTEDEVF